MSDRSASEGFGDVEIPDPVPNTPGD